MPSAGLLLCCSELFPTLIRSAVLGYQNQAARVGAIIAPFLVMASASSGAGSSAMVPFLVFGVASVLASLLIFTLPETLGVPLPDTMEVGGAAVLGTCARMLLNIYRLVHSVSVCLPAPQLHPLDAVDSLTHKLNALCCCCCCCCAAGHGEHCIRVHAQNLADRRPVSSHKVHVQGPRQFHQTKAASKDPAAACASPRESS